MAVWRILQLVNQNARAAVRFISAPITTIKVIFHAGAAKVNLFAGICHAPMNGLKMKKMLLLCLILVMILLFFLFDLGRFLTLEALKENRDALLAYQQNHKVSAAVLFIGIYTLQTALSLPGAAILSLAAGALFGTILGTLYANIAATTGATLAFLVSRYLLRNTVQARLGTRLRAINQELEHRGFGYLLFLRLVPVFPFFLINLAAGLTGLKLRIFFAATMVGIIPGSFIFCNAGAGLASLESPQQIFSPRVLASLALLGVFALVPTVYIKWRAREKMD